MTALKEFQRLETSGVWKADEDVQRRDVIVSFGDATIVLTDSAGRPVAHWSLAAVNRQNPGVRPAIFTPDTEATETLEIEDATMIGAIEKVRKAVAKSRTKPGKLRHLSTAVICAGIVAGAIFWLPDALVRQTMSVVPQSTRTEIGATILGHLQRNIGARCRGVLGTAALARMHTRLLGRDASGQIVVLPGGPNNAVALPGAIIVLNRSHVEKPDDPAVTAGYILAATTVGDLHDPLKSILDFAGLKVTLNLLTTGEIPADVLQAYAAQLLETNTQDAPIKDLLISFDRARAPSTPYALDIDPSGTLTAALINGDPLKDTQPPMILNDSEWVSLQGICTN